MLARIDYEFEQMEFYQMEFERMKFENLVRSFSGVFTVNLSAPVWALWGENWKKVIEEKSWKSLTEEDVA